MYIDYDGKRLMQVRCKGECANVLIRMVGKNVCKTYHYTEIVLALKEPTGLLSKHETAVCVDCRDRLLNDGPRIGELEAIFAEDIEQWIESGIRAGLSVAEAYRLAAQQAERAPIRVLNEPSRAQV